MSCIHSGPSLGSQVCGQPQGDTCALEESCGHTWLQKTFTTYCFCRDLKPYSVFRGFVCFWFFYDNINIHGVKKKKKKDGDAQVPSIVDNGIANPVYV